MLFTTVVSHEPNASAIDTAISEEMHLKARLTVIAAAGATARGGVHGARPVSLQMQPPRAREYKINIVAVKSGRGTALLLTQNVRSNTKLCASKWLA